METESVPEIGAVARWGRRALYLVLGLLALPVVLLVLLALVQAMF